MKTRRSFALCAAALMCFGASAQDLKTARYPDRPVSIISPFAPGGATDVLARILAQKLGEAWKQSVVVENRSGAGGVIAANTVARAAPDGHTLLLGSVGPIEVMPSLMKKMPYDPEKDLTPVGMLVNVENVLVVHDKLPVRTLSELVAYAKQNPGKLHFGSSGVATTGHLAGEVFKQQSGVDMVHVPYRGGANAVNALLAGEIDMIFSTVPSAMPHIRAGKLRPLAVTGAKSLAALPDVRPIRDQGLTNYAIRTWYGLFAPAGTPPEVVGRIHAELGRLLALPDVKARLLEQGWTTAHAPLPEVAQQISAGIREWKPVIARAGIRLE